MKYLITLILSILISFHSFSTTNDTNYPVYQFDSTSNKMLVIFTMEQAKMIDNDYDLLILLEKSKSECDSLDKAYTIVIKNQETVIASLEVKMVDLQLLDAKNTQIIKNLNGQIEKYKEDQIKSNMLLTNKESELTIYKKENRKLKVQKTVGFIGLGTFGGIAIGTSIYLIYLSVVK